MTEVREVNGYIQDTDGKWILSERTKSETTAMYFQGRLAYGNDRRFPIGVYSSTGEVVLFSTNVDKF